MAFALRDGSAECFGSGHDAQLFPGDIMRGLPVVATTMNPSALATAMSNSKSGPVARSSRSIRCSMFGP